MNLTEWKRRRSFARRVRAAVCATPELRAEYDRVRDARARPLGQRLLVWIGVSLIAITLPSVLIGFFSALVVSGAYAKSGPDGVLLVVSYMETCLTCLAGIGILAQLRRSPTMWMPVISTLPVSDREIAWHGWRTCLTVLSALVCFMLIGLVFVAFVERVGPWGWGLALAVAVLQWLLVAAIATLVANYWPSFPGATLGLYGLLAGMAFFCVYFWRGAPGLPIVANAFYWAIPAGWPSALYGRAYLQGNGWAWWALLPISLVIAAGFAALPRFIGRFRVREFECVSGVPALAASNYWSERVESIDFRILRKQLAPLKGVMPQVAGAPVPRSADEHAAAAELVRARFRSMGRAHSTGRTALGRWQRRLLMPRERDVFAYMTADSLAWNRLYPKVLTVCVAVLTVTWFMSPAFVPGHPFAFIVAIPALAIYSMYLRGGYWFGFTAPQFAGTCTSRYGLLPVGIDEISKLMLKVALFRGVLILPLLLSLLWSMCIVMRVQSIWLGFGIAALVLDLLYLVAHGWIIAARFAESASGVTSSHRWVWSLVRTAVSAPGSVILLIVAFLGSAIAVGLLSDFGLLPGDTILYFSLGLPLVFSLSSLCAWLLMRAMYQRGVVDLVRSRPSVGQQFLQSMEQAMYVSRITKVS